ncbi:LysR substrate-binding domain-containing protein [Luteibacter aegosomatissinici]|uniref:LysR substrate-binding domain-containing protein n=1 Tax=Luteibacter aegosomatissinici TaxID=2911539 RepID=UPI001FFBA0B1|nr:LysR substrate-binding domain-containing protein [Luteibacter aegosomatissinici]UPG93835.1 LysR substrate-binding domain-containing protein [Luteibacter aegosomatissinici]
MDSIDNLGDLYLLVQAIEAGGFSAAAAKLGTTRSLISRRILALEERLGARLLHRNARQFGVTATGERVYQYASAMCEAAQAAEQAAALQGDAQRLVRIEAHGLLSPMVASLMSEFTVVHPRVRFAVTVGGGDMNRLLRQQTDVILSLRETLPDSTDVVARALGGLRRVTVASPDLLKRVGTPRHPDDLDDDDCLALGADGAGFWHFRGMAPRRRNVRVALADVAALLAAVEGGLGVAQLPHYLVAGNFASGKLTTVLEAFEPEPLPLHALTVTGRVASDATVSFVRFMQSRLTPLT